MIGKYSVKVENNKIKYEFEVRRNITIIRGDSATGKTELLRLIDEYFQYGQGSGITLRCERTCRVLQGRDWEHQLSHIEGSIVFIDEISTFTKSEAFAKAIQGTDNYYVIVTRNNLENLPYSVDEIYGIRESGKYKGLKKIYNETYRLYGEYSNLKEISVDMVLVEDSNSGYEFFRKALEKSDIDVKSASGKSNIKKELIKIKNNDNSVAVIADGAAFGSQIEGIVKYQREREKIYLYLPESFEWLILLSGVLRDKQIEKTLEYPYDQIESEKYFSWERFFTALLVEKTENSPYAYKKKSLNPIYLQDELREKIMKAIRYEEGWK